MSESRALAESIRIGVIQTSLDYEAAWKDGPKISPTEEDRAITEIRTFLSTLRQESQPLDLVILPELSVPRGYEGKLKSAARALQSVVVAGLDYRDVSKRASKRVRNEAAIIVPSVWRGRRVSPKVSIRYFGKSYGAPQEKQALKKFGYELESDPIVQILDGGEIGRIGLMICYDVLDIERIAMYRAEVHHLIVLAYNRDTNSFDHAAEALARMVFCNVVICNCGFFGGSLVVSPYYRPERRVLYRHAGAKLPTAQVVTLPLRLLDAHQKETATYKTGEKPEFKGLPAGFGKSKTHIVEVKSIAEQQ